MSSLQEDSPRTVNIIEGVISIKHNSKKWKQRWCCLQAVKCGSELDTISLTLYKVNKSQEKSAGSQPKAVIRVQNFTGIHSNFVLDKHIFTLALVGCHNLVVIALPDQLTLNNWINSVNVSQRIQENDRFDLFLVDPPPLLREGQAHFTILYMRKERITLVSLSPFKLLASWAVKRVENAELKEGERLSIQTAFTTSRGVDGNGSFLFQSNDVRRLHTTIWALLNPNSTKTHSNVSPTKSLLASRRRRSQPNFPVSRLHDESNCDVPLQSPPPCHQISSCSHALRAQRSMDFSLHCPTEAPRTVPQSPCQHLPGMNSNLQCSGGNPEATRRMTLGDLSQGPRRTQRGEKTGIPYAMTQPIGHQPLSLHASPLAFRRLNSGPSGSTGQTLVIYDQPKPQNANCHYQIPKCNQLPTTSTNGRASRSPAYNILPNRYSRGSREDNSISTHSSSSSLYTHSQVGSSSDVSHSYDRQASLKEFHCKYSAVYDEVKSEDRRNSSQPNTCDQSKLAIKLMSQSHHSACSDYDFPTNNLPVHPESPSKRSLGDYQFPPNNTPIRKNSDSEILTDVAKSFAIYDYPHNNGLIKRDNTRSNADYAYPPNNAPVTLARQKSLDSGLTQSGVPSASVCTCTKSHSADVDSRNFSTGPVYDMLPPPKPVTTQSENKERTPTEDSLSNCPTTVIYDYPMNGLKISMPSDTHLNYDSSRSASPKSVLTNSSISSQSPTNRPTSLDSGHFSPPPERPAKPSHIATKCYYNQTLPYVDLARFDKVNRSAKTAENSSKCCLNVVAHSDAPLPLLMAARQHPKPSTSSIE